MRITYSTNDLGLNVNKNNVFQFRFFLCNLKPGMYVNRKSVLLFVEKNKKVYKFFSPVIGVIKDVHLKTSDFVNINFFKQPLITIDTIDVSNYYEDCDDKPCLKGKIQSCSCSKSGCSVCEKRLKKCSDRGFCNDRYCATDYKNSDMCKNVIKDFSDSCSDLKQCCSNLMDCCAALSEICDDSGMNCCSKKCCCCC